MVVHRFLAVLLVILTWAGTSCSDQSDPTPHAGQTSEGQSDILAIHEVLNDRLVTAGERLGYLRARYGDHELLGPIIDSIDSRRDSP